ncbi:hypothetical protein QBC33DRAFT_607160 [Phialemonium atrogriseum]|uniref:Peroxin 11C n=1 Tax=Phialemonium atrogriseum TaxID=1093897 RepID=A0AAJ0C1S2_9PEZI|nr:uncharacterized protein QBC33DRAFT_607160 [Phialemonium atrogriseum]KAK1768563.1 hypothetical protein QBC33DRAFT_607160 [Phialemonium atrogriseum]
MSADPAPSTGAIADLPSGEPIPSSAAPPSSSAPKPAPIPLGALLAASASNMDASLARLNRCLSTPSGIDTVLLFVGFAARLGSSALGGLADLPALHRRRARAWLALLAPRATVLLTSADPAASPSAAAILSLAARLRALSNLLSETRTMLRLWGLLGMYFWGRGLVAGTIRSLRGGASEKDKEQTSAASTAVSYLQLALCATFQALENGAYLSSKGVLGWTPAQQARASRWSARLWGAYVGVELGRLAAERVGAVPVKDAGEGAWGRAVVRNLAWAPLTLHWGSEKGVVSDWMVGFLACVPGTIQMRQLWKESA